MMEDMKWRGVHQVFCDREGEKESKLQRMKHNQHTKGNKTSEKPIFIDHHRQH